MRALGDSKTPLYFLILTSALNIGLDLCSSSRFRWVFWGAALATDISQVVSGVLSFIYLSRKFDVLKMQKSDFALQQKGLRTSAGHRYTHGSAVQHHGHWQRHHAVGGQCWAALPLPPSPQQARPKAC